jgi:hypothetical protein
MSNADDILVGKLKRSEDAASWKLEVKWGDRVEKKTKDVDG